MLFSSCVYIIHTYLSCVINRFHHKFNFRCKKGVRATMRNNPHPLQRIISAEKAIKARIRLAVLLHARNQHQHTDYDAHVQCSVPYCQAGRDVWKHISNCMLETDCSQPHCKSSRQILAHWEKCSKNQFYCKVCTPLKLAIKKKTRKIQVPDCWSSRDLISHYKECTLMHCERCKVIKVLNGNVCSSRSLIKRRVCHSGLLKHSCRCQDRTCKIPMCMKMKRVLTHTNICRQSNSNSLLCQEIATFCLNHSIVCTEKDCILSNKS